MAQLPTIEEELREAEAHNVHAQGLVQRVLRTIRGTFSVMNILYAIGGIIVIMGMCFLVFLAYQTMGGFGIMVLRRSCATTATSLLT